MDVRLGQAPGGLGEDGGLGGGAFRRQTDFLRARSEAFQSLKRALDQEGLTIPFPITTLDFGIAGGRALSEELRRSGVE